MSRRRWAAAVALAGALALSGCTSDPNRRPPTESTVPDPAVMVRDMTRKVDAGQLYRDPSGSEAQIAKDAVLRLLDAPATPAGYESAFAGLGFRTVTGTDPVTSRPYLLLLGERGTERSWGAILVDRSVPVSLVVEVPHTGFDLNTDVIGMAEFRARPGAVLLVAGAHRNAAGGLADVAHNDRSLFHALTTALAGRGLPQVQLHGFADESLPDWDVVVSVGAAGVLAQARAVSDALTTAGFDVCRAWERQCGKLEGNNNVQGRAAAQLGQVFVHVEISNSNRGDADSRARIVEALAHAM
ncbi:hypothetical protein Lfu02_59190 [Longispora fulva]|uniref:Uncharacterized protein n=1 Tax=Longispora fulva TaxID=619741 RepID=A0A8J7GQJ5_9ACTN|nr:hypothetical protein [Longispora fulva]MBG6137099.1 hypothetical protein [Longispora fulva]GIG61547.1 hypothetical protein Lfu02_59190 [Longispora fulva]